MAFTARPESIQLSIHPDVHIVSHFYDVLCNLLRNYFVVRNNCLSLPLTNRFCYMKQRLTAKEEAIMNIFWKHGELCIRELVDLMQEPKPGYTTIAKQVSFLEEKGFLTRRPLSSIFLYKAAISESEYQGSSINDLVSKYYSNSYSSLVLRFVEENKMNVEELKEIIDIIEKKK